MTTPHYLGRLEHKSEPDHGKVVSRPEDIRETIADVVDGQLRDRITDEVLSAADFEGPVERVLREREQAILGVLPSVEEEIVRHLRDNPAELWLDPVRRLALSIAIESGGGPRRLIRGRREAKAKPLGSLAWVVC